MCITYMRVLKCIVHIFITIGNLATIMCVRARACGGGLGLNIAVPSFGYFIQINRPGLRHIDEFRNKLIFVQ
jgi:hypothetical protein